ncbi:xanthine dehydrogenase [Amycolatopsis antarctica]|uniref:Xanthine dehydrogenase n=1 Tax=Amycolatopsis antarctica TaxID=1854586 RepID=A0A263D1W3_9PSEU|nr:XdhC family protein [Amycolatopsis antarctica]OZM72454.1 xanthine dehydrogenase [Amycolatopsis antarctica]
MVTDPDPGSCGLAHGEPRPDGGQDPVRTLVAVFASPVSERLLSYARDLGYRPVLVEPDAERAAGVRSPGVEVTGVVPELDEAAEFVVTDHHRPELGGLLRDALAYPARWIGIMGNPRHEGPHVAALTELGVAEAEIARVHRPVGLNIGSRTPAEIAVATIAGLIADRNGRPGGFTF